jgi:hypothetical protein
LVVCTTKSTQVEGADAFHEISFNLELRGATGHNDLEVLPGATCGDDSVVGRQICYWEFNVRKMQDVLVYGGLAAVIGLMMWMELSAMIVFLGAAWNAESAPRAD